MFRKQKFKIVAFLVLLLVAIWLLVNLTTPSPRIIGSLPEMDILEIQKLVWHDVKEVELPKLTLDDIAAHPGYVIKGVNRYHALHILWIDVKDDHYVRVVVGLSKQTINSNGWDFMVRKSSAWQITGTAYWGSPQFVPSDFRIPPD